MAISVVEPRDTVRHFSGSLNGEGLSEEWVQFEKQLEARPAVNFEGTPEDQKKAFSEGCAIRDKASLTQVLRDKVLILNQIIQGSPEKPDIPIRIYKKSDQEDKVSPAAVYFHGGGWILGNIQGDDVACRKLAYDSGHVVISVEYRLAPEHVFPAAIDDCYAAFQWTVKSAGILGIDRKKVYVTGNSAGGHLAAAVAIKVAQSEDPSALAAQVLRIPMTCHPQVYPGTLPDRGNAPIFNDSAALRMINSFVPNVADRTSPLVSPLLVDSETAKKLPPTYIDVCSVDPFAGPGIAYAKKLEDHGVPVKLFILEGMPHGSYMVFPTLPSSEVAQKACVKGTDWALSFRDR